MVVAHQGPVAHARLPLDVCPVVAQQWCSGQPLPPTQDGLPALVCPRMRSTDVIDFGGNVRV
jgi:hypothetical protein